MIEQTGSDDQESPKMGEISNSVTHNRLSVSLKQKALEVEISMYHNYCILYQELLAWYSNPCQLEGIQAAIS